MKSKYNFEYTRENGEHIIYNTYSKAIVSLNDEEYLLYAKSEYNDEMNKVLTENGILISDDFDETKYLKYLHFKAKFSKEVLHLTIAPTLDCNFDCPYCYENRRSGKMTEDIQNALVEYIENKVGEGVRLIDIAWYGGEPLLCMDVVENLSRKIKSIANKNKCELKMYMVTNGYLLTEDIVRILDEIGIYRVQITLDGLEECHDARRPLRNGGKTFSKIFENLKLFADYSIDVIIRMNVDNENQADYIDLKNKLDELDNPLISLYPSPVEDINEDKENNVSKFMTNSEFDDFTILSTEIT